MIIHLETQEQTQLIEITSDVKSAISASGIEQGICMLYVPHTTAAVTINENADPTVKTDILKVINQIIPWDADYRHSEGNSPAHIKAMLVGASEFIAIKAGKPVLGTWQGLFFCEFDGPRRRNVHVHVIEGQSII